MKEIEKVKEWHEKFCVPVAPYSRVPNARRIELRLSLLKEEAEELRGAIRDTQVNFNGLSNLELFSNILKEAADNIYVIHGTLLEFGLHNCFEDAFDEVHRSNMTKTVGNNREDGKILKGDTYVPPNLKKFFI